MSTNSTNNRLKLSLKIESILNLYGLLSLTLKQYNVAIYIVFTLY